MQLILTDISQPIKWEDMPNGKISLHELKVWPAWTRPKFKTIFSYERGGKKTEVPVTMGKRYTLRDFQLLVNEHLNTSEQVALLYHNNGRVSWRVFPGTKTTNVQLSAGLKYLLKLGGVKPYEGITTGQPIDQSSIHYAFSDASNVLLICDEAEYETRFNNTSSKTITAIPVGADLVGSLTANLTQLATTTFKNNYTNHLNLRWRCVVEHTSCL